MKPYAVEVTLHMVVMADDLKRARKVGRQFARDAARKDEFDDVFVLREVTSEDELPDEWDGTCVPYGGDGNTRLKDLLPASNQAHLRERSAAK